MLKIRVFREIVILKMKYIEVQTFWNFAPNSSEFDFGFALEGPVTQLPFKLCLLCGVFLKSCIYLIVVHRIEFSWISILK